MKRFICWYAYSGMETEGRLDLEEPKIIEADDKANAMWKWHSEHRGINMIGIHGSYEKFIEKGEFTGWGFWCEELV